MSKDHFEIGSTFESISDEEISLAIRYLDPEPRRNMSEGIAFLAVCIIVLFVYAVFIALSLRTS